MAVSSHRNYVSSTAEDLERAAGRLITSCKATNDKRMADMLRGGAYALYALAWHDIKSEDDMLTVWSMLATSDIVAGLEE